jgi:hypothetical protein
LGIVPQIHLLLEKLLFLAVDVGEAEEQIVMLLLIVMVLRLLLEQHLYIMPFMKWELLIFIPL